MHSSHDGTHSMYEANLDAKTTNTIELPDGVVLDNAVVAPDEINNQTLKNETFKELSDRDLDRHSRFVPSTGYK